MNPSQPSPVMDKTYSNSSQPSSVRKKGYNSRLSDTSPMPPRHPSYSSLPKYEEEQIFDNDVFELSSRNSPTSPSAALYPRPRQQRRTLSLPAYNYNSIRPNFQGPHEEEQHHPPRPHFQRPNEEKQHQHAYPPGPSSSDTHYTTLLSVPQTISPTEPSSSFSHSHATYLPTASDYVFPPSPTTVPGRSGMGIDEDEQRKSKVPKVYPVCRSVAHPKGREAPKVRVSSGAQAVSGSTSTTSMSPLSDLPVPVPLVPPVQVQAGDGTPPMVPQHRLHQDDSVQPSSSPLPLSVPAPNSSVPWKPQDKNKDSTSPTTSTPTPVPFIYPSGRSRANPKAKPKPSITDPTRFKRFRLLKDKIKKPDKGKQREQDKQVEDGSEMQMMLMLMKSGGSESTSNFSGSWCLVRSTVDLGVGAGGDGVADRVFDIRRATDSNRIGVGNAYGGEQAMKPGGKSRVGSYPLNPFDAVLLDQYVFTLFYC